MNFKKTIVLPLLALLLVQSGLVGAGSLFVCLHDFGQGHLVTEKAAGECCHQVDRGMAASQLCENCTDLTFGSLDFVPWRNSSQQMDVVSALPQASFSVDKRACKHSQYAFVCPPRAPPLLEPMARLHVRTIRLRI